MVKVFHYVKALTEAFLDHLWKILQNPSQPAILRQTAAGYLGSLLARAKFIPVLWVYFSAKTTLYITDSCQFETLNGEFLCDWRASLILL